MADIKPFAALRYDAARVGGLENVITQPYDKITPAMLERYRALSPYNLSNVVKNTDYAAAAAHLESWKREGVLRHDPEPSFYAYAQDYVVPGTTQKRTRKALVAALRLEDYSKGVVFPHERTLRGPKQDRLELMRTTRTHCELLFLLYEDPTGEIAALLDRATADDPIEQLHDDFDDLHSVWRTTDQRFVRALADRRLVMADGHHRYETMLAFREENPAADRVLVALVAMDAPGLTILPTHRLLSRVAGFSRERLLASAAQFFTVSTGSAADLAPNVIGVAFADSPDFTLLRLKPETDLAALLPDLSPAQRRLDVVLLHQLLLRICLGIDEEATRQEKNLEYIREFEKGMTGVRNGAQACFFLHPVGVKEMCDIAFAGGVMPQKLTDFYPKMLSGLAMYEAM